MWFVEVLMICYFIYGFMVINLKSDKYIIIVSSMMFLGWYLIEHPVNIILLSGGVGIGYMNFFVGCILYEVQTRNKEKSLKSISILGMICLIVIVIAVRCFGTDVIGNVDLCCSLFVFPIMIITINNINIIKSIFSNKLLLFVSQIATSLFFTHLSFLFIVKIINNYYQINLNYGSVNVFAIIFIIEIIIAAIYKILIEKYLTNCIKSKMEKKYNNT